MPLAAVVSLYTRVVTYARVCEGATTAWKQLGLRCESLLYSVKNRTETASVLATDIKGFAS